MASKDTSIAELRQLVAQRAEQIELPDAPLRVTDHRFRLCESPEGDLYDQHDPEVHRKPIFGPRLLAIISWMKSTAHCSYSTIERHF